MTKASDNQYPSVLLDEQAGNPSTPASGFWRLYTKSDGLYVIDDGGSTTGPMGASGGSGQGLVDFASAKRTSGDVTCSADSVWTDVDTGIDLTLTCATGDWLEIGLSSACFDTANVTLHLTAMTIVSASPVNDVATNTSPSNTTTGVSGWNVANSAIGKSSGSILYQTVSGDISGGNVVLRLRYRTSNSTNRNLEADTNTPLHFWAKNLGPSM